MTDTATQNGTKQLIQMFEEKLIRYELQLSNNPTSIFYKGLVKNTKEVIEELKEIKNEQER